MQINDEHLDALACLVRSGPRSLSYDVARALVDRGFVEITMHTLLAGFEISCTITRKGLSAIKARTVRGMVVALDGGLVIARLEVDPSGKKDVDYGLRRCPAHLRQVGASFVATWLDGVVYDPRLDDFWYWTIDELERLVGRTMSEEEVKAIFARRPPDDAYVPKPQEGI